MDSVIETHSRDNIFRRVERTEDATVALSQTIAKGGVLGRVDFAAGTADADDGNTGDGAISGFALTADETPIVGDYVATCVAEATNGGTFNVVDPNGRLVGVATVGTAFSAGGITFTIADGDADWDLADFITFPVAAGAGTVKLLDKTATDGSQKFHGIALEAVTTTSATAKTCIATACTVQSQGLSFASGTVIADVIDQMRLKSCYVDTTDADENVMGA